MRKRRERLKAWQESKAKEQEQPAPAPVPLSQVELEVESYIQKLESDRESSHKEVDSNLESKEEEEEGEKALGWSLEDEGEDEDEGANKEVLKDDSMEEEKELQVISIKEVEEEIDDKSASIFKQIGTTSSTNTTTNTTAVIPVAISSKGTSLGKTRRSTKWSSSKATNTTSSSLSAPAAVVVDDADDPLDAFMNSLYSSGDVAVQKDLSKNSTKLSEDSHKPMVITLDEILLGNSNFNNNSISNNDTRRDVEDNNNNNNRKKKRSPPGWESDAGGGGGGEEDPPSPSKLDEILHDIFDDDGNDKSLGRETDEEREGREERERQEFLSAILAARRDEGVVREALRKLDDTTSFRRNNEEVGRVFGGEGDLSDEEVLDDAPKKTALEIFEEARRGRLMREVDHSQVDYLPFRKNLYIVPRAIGRLSDEEVQEKREDLHIKVRGRGCPAPVDNW